MKSRSGIYGDHATVTEGGLAGDGNRHQQTNTEENGRDFYKVIATIYSIETKESLH